MARMDFVWCAEGGRELAVKTSELASDEARPRADAALKKEERARDGAKAMSEYLDNARVVRERMGRLRTLRLAKEAADRKNALAAAQASVKPAKAAKRQSGGR